MTLCALILTLLLPLCGARSPHLIPHSALRTPHSAFRRALILEFERTQCGKVGSAHLRVGMGRVGQKQVLHLAQNVGGIGVSTAVEKEIIREEGAPERVAILVRINVFNAFHLPVAGA